MSYAEIEAELDRLAPDELRRLALKSWTAFVQKEGHPDGGNECEENDPGLLAALDEAIAQADATPGQGHAGPQVHTRSGSFEDVLARLDGRFPTFQSI